MAAIARVIPHEAQGNPVTLRTMHKTGSRRTSPECSIQRAAAATASWAAARRRTDTAATGRDALRAAISTPAAQARSDAPSASVIFPMPMMM